MKTFLNFLMKRNIFKRHYITVIFDAFLCQFTRRFCVSSRVRQISTLIHAQSWTRAWINLDSCTWHYANRTRNMQLYSMVLCLWWPHSRYCFCATTTPHNTQSINIVSMSTATQAHLHIANGCSKSPLLGQYWLYSRSRFHTQNMRPPRASQWLYSSTWTVDR